MRCANSTIVQLKGISRTSSLENNLSALVVELAAAGDQAELTRKNRVRELAPWPDGAHFLCSSGGRAQEIDCQYRLRFAGCAGNLSQTDSTHVKEHFIVIADARFPRCWRRCVVAQSEGRVGGDEVIWTFEPDIVYSALEYLMARVGAEHPYHSPRFDEAVRTSMPKATSLQLTVSVTTKLAHLLQEQAGREIAVNHIATAIRESLELGVILQKTVDEVGAALNVSQCVLRVEGQTPEQSLTYFYFDDPSKRSIRHTERLSQDLEDHCRHLAEHQEVLIRDGDDELISSSDQYPTAVVPLVFQESLLGGLQSEFRRPLTLME